MALATRRNIAPNPRPASNAGYVFSGAGQVVQPDGWARLTTTATATTFMSTSPYTSAALPFGDQETTQVSVDVRADAAAVQTFMSVFQYDGSTEIVSGRTVGPREVLAAGETRRISVAVTRAQLGAGMRVLLYVMDPVGSTYSAGNVLEWRRLQVGDGQYLDGSMPADELWSYAWEGAADASPSVATEVPALTIAAEAQPVSASVLVSVRGGAPGTPLYVLRRDTSGTGIVRETSEGSIVWPALGDTLTLTDYEARQGEATQYLLTDRDGTPVASTEVQLPVWGTWVKSPGRPYRNARAFYVGDSAATLSARRVVVDIEGAAQRVVFAGHRSTPSGSIVLLTQTRAQREALATLLSDGMPLMLDTPATWGVPYRYMSVGDVAHERAYNFEGLNLTAEARLWTFDEVVSTAVPQGLPNLDPGRTYADLPTLFATYVAIPATVETYERLATGEEF